MSSDQTPPHPSEDKPLFLLRNSPLVGGGKARLMSGKKVLPKRATPREVSESESHGYTTEPTKALSHEPECLSEADWKRHVEKRAEQSAEQRRTLEEIARDRDRRLLSQEERIAKAHRDAQTKRRDVSREMWVLRQMQAQGRKPDLIEKRVQELERIVYLSRGGDDVEKSAA